MSKQTQLPWASSSSSRGPPRNGSTSSGSKDDRDIAMKDQPAHFHNRTLYKATRSHSLTPSMAPTARPAPAAVASATASSAAASSSVLGKRGGGRPSPFAFVDGDEPLDYKDFAQAKLPVHTLLYLCADRHYANKHTADDDTAHDTADERQHPADTRSSTNKMDVIEEDQDEKTHQSTPPPPPQPADTRTVSIRYDAIAPSANHDPQHPSALFAHHPFHCFYRSHKAALAAWKQRQGVEAGSSGSAAGRVMEFACREPLHVLRVSAQQRPAVFATAAASLSSSSSSSPTADSHVPSPPALLEHLLSAHNDCVGYEVEGAESDGVVLTSSACECQLSLLDDDKRAHVSQALLTDMFARLHC